MAVEKVKYNKTALKAQRDGLAKYEKFLPILQLKKMQLQIVLRQLEPQITAKERELSAAAEGIRPWSRLLSDPGVDINDFLNIQEVRVEMDNIAGVEVPEFREVAFQEAPYSLFATPSWLDTAIDSMRHLVAIREEIQAIEDGQLDSEDNPLRHAPHPASVVCADDWPHAYPRALAAYPAPWSKVHKYWPYVSRVDNGYGEDIIPLDYTGYLLLIHVGPHADDVGNHDLLEFFGGGDRDELSKGDDPDEMTPVIHDIDVENHFRFRCLL